MKRLMSLAAGASAACLIVGLSQAGADSASVVCTDSFSGTAYNVIVPDNDFCVLSGATITNDLVIGSGAGAGAGLGATEPGLTVGNDVTLQKDSEVDFGATVIGNDLTTTTDDSVHLERTTIRHDLDAFQPATVQTGKVGRDTPGGPVRINHDLVIKGTPPHDDFVFDGLSNLTVGDSLQISGRSVTLGIGIVGDTIGTDLVMTNDSALVGFFGPSSLFVSQNNIGRDLIFTGNSAAPGGELDLFQNVVGRDATCAHNNPAPTTTGNVVTRFNTCG